jgi:tRNA G18 (ribose-2'-O)-methylase SpoU
MRGYFGIGVEGISKQMNLGSVFRTAHAFGASFVFTVGAVYAPDEGGLADTSDTPRSLPLYEFDSVDALRLPTDCDLVGIELMDDAVELPSFRHPRCAAYVLGPERGVLSPELVARCAHVVKIPTKFSINLALAGALVMYDRLISAGRFGARPIAAGGPVAPPPRHQFGPPVIRRLKTKETRGSKKA